MRRSPSRFGLRKPDGLIDCARAFLAALMICGAGACRTAADLAALKLVYRAWRSVFGCRAAIENRACIGGGTLSEAEICTDAVTTVAII